MTYATNAKAADAAMSTLSGHAVGRFFRSATSTTADAIHTPARIP
ncbi:hypothetical protein [Streptomyces sp. NBC_01235]|nr:hypothetical protein OG289_30785 [Streptomyces sp. NBC_01235]